MYWRAESKVIHHLVSLQQLNLWYWGVEGGWRHELKILTLKSDTVRSSNFVIKDTPCSTLWGVSNSATWSRVAMSRSQKWHSVTSQKTWIFSNNVRTTNLASMQEFKQYNNISKFEARVRPSWHNTYFQIGQLFSDFDESQVQFATKMISQPSIIVMNT